MSAPALLSALALLAAPQLSDQPEPQTPPQTAPATAGGEVDLGAVDAVGQRSIVNRAARFVEEVVAAPPGRGLARWDRAVCVGVANLKRPYAQFMIDRVSAIAIELGLEVGEPGCRPNILIVAENEPDSLARGMVEEDRFGFRPALNHTDLGSRALEQFQSTDAPVRWWLVSLPVGADTGEIAIRLKDEEAPQLRVREASHLSSNVRDDLVRAIVILDASRMDEVRFDGLSDYVALVALAQIDATADVSSWPSVLNLFTAEEQMAGLTDWDLDYLHALYDAPRNLLNPDQQAREIVRGLVEEQTRSQEERPAAAPTPTP